MTLYSTIPFSSYRDTEPQEFSEALSEIPSGMSPMRDFGLSAIMYALANTRVSARQMEIVSSLMSGQTDLDMFDRRLKWRGDKRLYPSMNSRKELIKTGLSVLVLARGIGMIARRQGLTDRLLDPNSGEAQFFVPEAHRRSCAENMKIDEDVTDFWVSWKGADPEGDDPDIKAELAVSLNTASNPDYIWATARVATSNDGRSYFFLDGHFPTPSKKGLPTGPERVMRLGQSMMVACDMPIEPGRHSLQTG